MMKQLLLSLVLSSSLFSASLFTLDNLRALNIYVINKSDFLQQEQEIALKKILTEKLKAGGFILGETDAPLFVVTIDALEIDGSQVLHIEVGVGEEVVTRRKDKIATFAYTYTASQFLEGYSDPYKNTVESLTSLVNDFIKSYKEDN